MAFADDLLKQAYFLLNRELKHPTQASLRRSVSTAYYSLFHLLVEEACLNWGRADTRDYLARAFDHKTMKDASVRAENATYDRSIPPPLVAKLRSVARAFRELQIQRHLADYSNATKWDRSKAEAKLDQAKSAFGDWKSIRNEYVAQRYLVSLLSSFRED